LFVAEGRDEAKVFFALLHDLLIKDVPAVIAVFTIRSDNYESLQLAPELDGLHQETLSLPAMLKGSYAEVIKGPASRLAGTERPLEVEDALVNTLLTDVSRPSRSARYSAASFRRVRALQRLGLCFGIGPLSRQRS